MKYLIPIFTAILATTLVGCQTKATKAQHAVTQTATFSCIDRIAGMREKIAQAKPQRSTHVEFKDERNAVMYLMVEKMADSMTEMARANSQDNEMRYCNEVYIAMLNADTQRFNKLLGLGDTAIRWVTGTIGLKILKDGIVQISRPDGGQGEVWNVSGSRVVNRSSADRNSSVSSSGTGLGLGNTTGLGRGNTQGGVIP